MGPNFRFKMMNTTFFYYLKVRVGVCTYKYDQVCILLTTAKTLWTPLPRP